MTIVISWSHVVWLFIWLHLDGSVLEFLVKFMESSLINKLNKSIIYIFYFERRFLLQFRWNAERFVFQETSNAAVLGNFVWLRSCVFFSTMFERSCCRLVSWKMLKQVHLQSITCARAYSCMADVLLQYLY